MRRKQLLAFLSLPLVLLLPRTVCAKQAPDSPSAEIVVTGRAEVVLAPDFAWVRIGVTIHDSTAAAAAAANGLHLRAIMDTLAALGFPRDSVTRLSYGVEPNYNWRGNRQITGYRVAAVIRLTVRDLATLPAIIDAALGAGATDIPQITFRSDTAEVARRRVLQEALTTARADAEAIAQAADGQLGELLEVHTGSRGIDYAGYGFSTVYLEQASGHSAGLELTSQGVILNVVVEGRWQFVPGGG